jgi:hypothetical protein
MSVGAVKGHCQKVRGVGFLFDFEAKLSDFNRLSYDQNLGTGLAIELS